MTGGTDSVYISARATLLDALEALQDQLPAVIIVGAQAIYLNTGEANFAVAPFTSDADLALDPQSLKADPKLADALRAAGFVADAEIIGTWFSSRAGIPVDLMVPAAVAGKGRRAARLGEHGDRVARKTQGLEAALIDKQQRTICAFTNDDPRAYEVAVAGPLALLVAKLHKLAERQDNEGRRNDKDALDIYRLLQATDTEEMATTFAIVRGDSRAQAVADQALRYLEALFGAASSVGSEMAARSAAPLIDHDEVTASCAALAQDLLAAIRG